MRPTDILQLKVTLLGSRPSIWRSIRIPADSSFFELHVALQDAFGWEDSHLHQFHTADPRTRRSESRPIGFPMTEMEHVVDERKVRLLELLGKPKARIWYEYDFGDSWTHEIVVQRITGRDPKVRYPLLVDGARARPPEDCGGSSGYSDLLKILRRPNHERYEEMLEWLGIHAPEEFDPERFEMGAVEFRNPQDVLRRYEDHLR